MDDSITSITDVATLARSCWIEIWPGWKRFIGHPDPDGAIASLDTCIPTSFALREVLERCVGDWRWHVLGGRSTSRTPKGGLWFPDGCGGPHLWVEGRKTRRRVTVDITA